VENIQKKSSLNEEMQELIKQREAFRVEARRLLTSVVLPRIRAVAHHFDNAIVEESLGEDFRCACRWSKQPAASSARGVKSTSAPRPVGTPI
jgi:hypothetical protein